MNWLEVTIGTSREAADAVTERLMQMASRGVVTDDPGVMERLDEVADETWIVDPSTYEEPDDTVRIRAYFPEFDAGVAFRPAEDLADGPSDERTLYDPDDYPEHRGTRDELTRALEAALHHVGQFLDVSPALVEIREVRDEDWQDAWKAHYRPIPISRRITVVPSWSEAPDVGEDGHILRLDPGSAFGTGDHASTSLAMTLLDDYMIPDARVADVGCGSGILSIAAAMLGAVSVDAVDIDPHAVNITEENAALNGVADRIRAVTGEVDALDRTYHLIVANLVADLLIRIAPKLASRLTATGLLLTSGIVRHRQDDVHEAFTRAGLTLFHTREDGEWVAMIFAH